MAITINQSPQGFTMSDNDLVWVWTSNVFAQPNFVFEVDLVVDGNVITTDQIFPRSGGTAMINYSELVAPLFTDPVINTDISTQADLIQSMQVRKSVNIVIREIYGVTPTVQDTETSAIVDVWKASLSDLGFIDYDSDDYADITTDNTLFLTNFPRNEKYWVDIEKSNYLCFFFPTNDNVTMRVRAFDASGTSISSFSYNFGDKFKDVYILNVSPKELTAVNFTGAVYYEVTILINFTNPYETFRYWINRPCVKDRTVYFINKLGGVDSWIFNKRKTSDRTFDRELYERDLGRLLGTSYVYDKFNSRMVNHFNVSENEISLATDWTNQEVLTWLVREMLESTLVWMEDENDNKIAMHLTTASEEEPQERYEELSQLVINLASGFKSQSVCR